MGLIVSTVQYLFGGGGGEDMDKPDAVTGLTPRHKNAIRESWKLVSVDLKNNGVAFFTKFFTDHPQNQNFFDAFRGKKLEEVKNTVKMRSHAATVMHALTSVVETLDDPECLIEILKKNAQAHYNRNIRIQQYKELFESFVAFLPIGLGDKCTKLTQESWEKALAVVVAVIEGEMTAMSNGPAKSK